MTGKTSGTMGRLSYTVTLYTAPGDKTGESVRDRTLRHELAHAIMMVGKTAAGEQHARISAMERNLKGK